MWDWLEWTAQWHNTEHRDEENLETADENGDEMDMMIDYEPPIEEPPASLNSHKSPSNMSAAPVD